MSHIELFISFYITLYYVLYDNYLTNSCCVLIPVLKLLDNQVGTGIMQPNWQKHNISMMPAKWRIFDDICCFIIIYIITYLYILVNTNIIVNKIIVEASLK